MNQQIKERCEIISKNFKEINPERKGLLEKLASHIQEKFHSGKEINLVYVCTHNSRRSHLGQIWAKVAADFYGFNINFQSIFNILTNEPNLGDFFALDVCLFFGCFIFEKFVNHIMKRNLCLR